MLNLTKEGEEQFKKAAAILAQNKLDCKDFSEEELGNSERIQKAMRDLIKNNSSETK